MHSRAQLMSLSKPAAMGRRELCLLFVVDDIPLTTIAKSFANLEDRALLRLEDILAHKGFFSLPAARHLNPSMALAKAMQERGHETIVFNVADRERAITERGLGSFSMALKRIRQGSLPRSSRRPAG
jgi:hypothetical protein